MTRTYKEEEFRTIQINIKSKLSHGTWILFPKNFISIIASNSFAGVASFNQINMDRVEKLVRKEVQETGGVYEKD